MAVLVGQSAPNFQAKMVQNNKIQDVKLSDYLGKYVILFFYPLDFTFVCPTELLAFQDRLQDFNKLNAVILGCSVDSHYSHNAWLKTPLNRGGIEGVTYGLISDLGGDIARSYDVLSKDKVAYRGLFLIDREGKVRHQLVNDLPLGRSIPEAIRILEALQHYENHGEVCPADWKKESKAIKPTAESVGEYLASKRS